MAANEPRWAGLWTCCGRDGTRKWNSRTERAVVPGIPALLDENQAAEILRVKPCTVRNERVRGKLGFTKVGKRIFYTAEQLTRYLQIQSVEACVSETAIPSQSPARSVPTGSARSPAAMAPPMRGAARGTITESD